MQLCVTRNVRRLAVGQVVYTAMCYEHGGMIDDGTVYRLGDNNFRWIGGNDLSGLWLREQAGRRGLDAWVKTSTDELANIAVQGPRSREILESILWTAPTWQTVGELGWFRFSVARLGDFHGMALVVSRTGYTGELGYELFCHPKDARTLFDAVMEAGEPFGIAPFGLAALDMVRIEAGLVFAGCEFCDRTDPFEAGIGFTVPLKSKTDDFIGREALERRKAHPVRTLVGLDLAGGVVPSTGDCVRIGRAQVGEITSAVRSPILGKVIALCRMDVTHASPRLASRGRATRRSPEAHPGPGRVLPPLRPREAAGARRLRLIPTRCRFSIVRDLTRRFGGLFAVSDLSFAVEEGEIRGLIGPNGAGKTTTFNVISGFYPPSEGRVLFLGDDVSGLPTNAIAARGLVRTFQATTLFQELSVLENVLVGCHLKARTDPFRALLGTDRAREEAARGRALEILEFFGLAERREEPGMSLPHGLQRALGMAVAFAADPKLLLLDEPFTGMNPEETGRMMDIVRKVRDRGVTILLVEHDMQAVMGLCDRITVLNFGRLLCEGSPGEVRRHPEVIEAYLGAAAHAA